MLLNIKTGYRGIRKRPQDELIYIVCRIKDIVAQCPAWCFTDGHAKNKLTEFYNDIKDLTHVDWEVVCTQFWGNDEANMDAEKTGRIFGERLCAGFVCRRNYCQNGRP